MARIIIFLQVPTIKGNLLRRFWKVTGNGNLTTRRNAHVIVTPEGGHNQVAIEVLGGKTDKEGHNIRVVCQRNAELTIAVELILYLNIGLGKLCQRCIVSKGSKLRLVPVGGAPIVRISLVGDYVFVGGNDIALTILQREEKERYTLDSRYVEGLYR